MRTKSQVVAPGDSIRVYDATVNALTGKAHVEHQGGTDLLTPRSSAVEVKGEGVITSLDSTRLAVTSD